MIRLIETKKFEDDQLIKLYGQVGWTNYTQQPERLVEGIANSLYCIAAFDEHKLVGLCRLVGDGVTIMFVQDILVLPSYQRQGIGKALLEKSLERFSDCYQIHLLTDNSPKTRQFYQSIGFREVSEIDCVSFTYLNR
ncbi:GNAT family N-acetyltransferase [Streptococcus fryi]